ncbi:FMN-dependent NADH-azoreductase [Roseivivax sp. THAF40]|uniref:FMN-dependent NADH-azoreductase n=1 Tax=unclassified Roseivivax TaxID=2639302 RepID=UPI001268B693|nr:MULTISPECIES: NAD(P)H-dependent oxidoreductase [unclassified Roseivivax]QFS81413.1 FMN-dependent NADH-azoreductase [Roseivivax sp. THAF197b]QFT45142.1 FMN-dependent NADH-azoreductase [Roseivivax sp. THAF40]
MTDTVLRIDTSARRDGSISRQLTDRVIDKLAPRHVITRDLATPLPHVDERWIGANFTPGADRSDEQKATLALSDDLIAELQSADTLVIGLPVYNFGVPVSFKTWIDLVARVGVTFRYTEAGPEGLLTGKRAILVVASGGTKAGSDYDFASTYARHILGFMGITDVEVVSADELAIQPEETVKAAEAQVDRLAA